MLFVIIKQLVFHPSATPNPGMILSFELKVPIDYETDWFKRMRSIMSEIPVAWQKGYCHITLAFIDDTPIDLDLRQIIKKNLDAIETPTITFDKIGAFEITTGLGFIHLGVSEIPSQFLSMVESMRNDLKDVAVRCFLISGCM